MKVAKSRKRKKKARQTVWSIRLKNLSKRINKVLTFPAIFNVADYQTHGKLQNREKEIQRQKERVREKEKKLDGKREEGAIFNDANRTMNKRRMASRMTTEQTMRTTRLWQ